MKTILFGIFAHPDDEAFGPSATLIKEVSQGTEVYLICASRGEAGIANYEELGDVRLEEWREACGLIGVTGSFNLDCKDGSLCNATYHEIAQKVESIIREVCENQHEAVELRLMTFDTNGLSGHLDHVAMSYITTFVFYRLRSNAPRQTTVKELAYFCLSLQQMPQPNLSYFVFMPAGRPADYITRQVDVRELLDKKYEVMKAHRSQHADAEQLMSYGHDFHATDNFHVISS